MYLLLATLVFLSATGLIMLAKAGSSAPEGFEDADGFHALNPDDLAVAMPAERSFGPEGLVFLEQHVAAQPWL